MYQYFFSRHNAITHLIDYSNFFMYWEVKKFVWLALLFIMVVWNGTCNVFEVSVNVRCISVCAHVCMLSCGHLFCDPMDCSPSGFSVHGIFQARILEWVAISSSRGSSQCRVWIHICVSWIDRRILYHWATWEALLVLMYTQNVLYNIYIILLNIVLVMLWLTEWFCISLYSHTGWDYSVILGSLWERVSFNLLLIERSIYLVCQIRQIPLWQ